MQLKLRNTLVRAVPELFIPMIYKTGHVEEVEFLFIVEKEDFIGIGVNRGPNPCCYITQTSQKVINDQVTGYGTPFYPHGGFTFSGSNMFAKIAGIKGPILTKSADPILNDLYWLGWDYAHLGDYIGYSSVSHAANDKKWKTTELIEETKRMINEFIKTTK